MLLQNLRGASTRAGIECMGRLHSQFARGPLEEALRKLYTRQIDNEAAHLLVSATRLNLLRDAVHIIELYGQLALPIHRDQRFALASNALFACCPRLLEALGSVGFCLECASPDSVSTIVARLGAERAIALGVSRAKVKRTRPRRPTATYRDTCDFLAFGSLPRP